MFKLKISQLFATELMVFLSQILVFFTVAFLMSNMFASEQKLNEFINGKLNATTVSEFIWTLVAVICCHGLIDFLGRLAPGKFFSRISAEVLDDFPRTIYLFGSSTTAIFLSIAMYSAIHPSTTKSIGGIFMTIPVGTFSYLSIFFGLTFFLYGFFLKTRLACQREKKGNQYMR